jgi:hypothetical protein
MFNKKEIITILIVTLILAFAISLVETIEIFLYTLLAVFLLIIINIIAKKIMAFYLESEIEIKLWEVKQYGFSPSQHFKKPVPFGAFLPLISKIFLFPIQGLVWMASLVFDVKPKIYRAAKRHGLYSFSEITESHMGLIAAAGIIANLIIALVSYLIGFQEFTRLSIFYTFFNMLPISDLDGNKIFFGNIILWSFLASIVLIGIFFTLFVI